MCHVVFPGVSPILCGTFGTVPLFFRVFACIHFCLFLYQLCILLLHTSLLVFTKNSSGMANNLLCSVKCFLTTAGRIICQTKEGQSSAPVGDVWVNSGKPVRETIISGRKEQGTVALTFRAPEEDLICSRCTRHYLSKIGIQRHKRACRTARTVSSTNRPKKLQRRKKNLQRFYTQATRGTRIGVGRSFARGKGRWSVVRERQGAPLGTDVWRLTVPVNLDTVKYIHADVNERERINK